MHGAGMSMKADVKQLLPLQELDQKLHDLHRLIEAEPRVLAPHEQRIREAEASATEEGASTQEMKLEAGRRDLSVKEFDEKISKLEGQVSQVRKNDEYQALMKEINSAKADRRVAEDSLLEMWGRIEHQDTLKKAREEELSAARRERDKVKAEVDGRVAKLQAEAGGLETQRDGLRGPVDADLLEMYERILAAKSDGLALAAVEYQPGTRHESGVYICTGCNINLTLDVANAVMMGREPVSCKMCARLMYYEHTEPVAKK